MVGDLEGCSLQEFKDHHRVKGGAMAWGRSPQEMLGTSFIPEEREKSRSGGVPE